MSLKYFSSKTIERLQAFFSKEMAEKGIHKDNSSVRQIREFMFEFFELKEFQKFYFRLALDVMDAVGIDKQNAVLQMLPTPRVFRPGAIGTSYHCDYWYGHGELSYTVWLPLSDLETGNTFKVVGPENVNGLYKTLEQDNSYMDLPADIIASAVPVLPKKGEAYVFSSKLLHGSPINSSKNTRLSFDFRLSPEEDPTSTKDLANYYHYKNDGFVLPKHELDGGRVLKYICGGKGKNTFIQHITIEAAAKRYNMNVYEQEAEIERFGFPVLKSYLVNHNDDSKLDGLIIATKNILDQEVIACARNSTLKVWCALENDYLKNL